MNARELALKLISPIAAELTTWIEGKEPPGTKRPKVLALLPNQLQSEVSLARLEARRAAGLEPKPEEKGAIELPGQTSSLKVTTGPLPE